MPLSLHSAIVPSWLQVLGSVCGMVDKAEQWCTDEGHTPSEIIGAQLIGDMLPFGYQVKSCWTHSAHAVDGVRKGSFEPEITSPPDSFDGLRELIVRTTEALEATGEDELEQLASHDMVFSIGDKLRMEFTGQDFLLSFANPNFYFHAATAYDILRMKGLEIGKRDYLGALRLKQG